MADKCKSCGAKFVRYPLKDDNGNVIWTNLFKMDMMSLFFLFCIICMIVGYKLDMNQCTDAIKDPCTFCEKCNCCDYIGDNTTTVTSGFDTPDLNFTLDINN